MANINGPFVIGTDPNRRVDNWRNRGVQKYAQVQRNGKFRFVVALDDATSFRTAGAMFQALQRRAQALRGAPTADLIAFQVQPGGLRVVGTIS